MLYVEPLNESIEELAFVILVSNDELNVYVEPLNESIEELAFVILVSNELLKV